MESKCKAASHEILRLRIENVRPERYINCKYHPFERRFIFDLQRHILLPVILGFLLFGWITVSTRSSPPPEPQSQSPDCRVSTPKKPLPQSAFRSGGARRFSQILRRERSDSSANLLPPCRCDGIPIIASHLRREKGPGTVRHDSARFWRSAPVRAGPSVVS